MVWYFIGTVLGFVACLAWGHLCWLRGFAMAEEIANYDTVYLRAECARVQSVLHAVPCDIVRNAMTVKVLPEDKSQ